ALTAENRRILGDVLVGPGGQIVVDWVISGYEPPRQQLLDDIDATVGWAMAAGMAALGVGEATRRPRRGPECGLRRCRVGALSGPCGGSFGLTRARVGSSPASQRSGRPCRSARGVLA